MQNKTILHDLHVQNNASMFDFQGWHMPLHYGSQIKEHQMVRQDCGIFDVSHMSCVDIKGPQSEEMLSYALANDVSKLHNMDALYTTMLNQKGGVIDDLIVYRVDQISGYRLVINAATTYKDLNHISKLALDFETEVVHRKDLAIIAVQGPNAISKVKEARPNWNLDIKAFKANLVEDDILVARTGYTGEDGLEILIFNEMTLDLVKDLMNLGVGLCGLGARDSLRLEAGLNLYSNDMDEDVSPFEAGLGWTVSLGNDREFVGKKALIAELEADPSTSMRQSGAVLKSGGVLRKGFKVQTDKGDGVVTSGGYSPLMQCSIALVRIPKLASKAFVEIRGKKLDLELRNTPFVRKGKILEN